MSSNIPPVLTACDDPMGNGQPAWRIDAADGKTANAFVVKHADGGLRLVLANAPADASPDFELTAGKMKVS